MILGVNLRAGALSQFLCCIYTEIQGQVTLAPKAYRGGKAVVGGGKKGWRSCQEYAGTEAVSFFLPMERGTREGSDLLKALGSFSISVVREGKKGGIALFFTNRMS